jgi:hypothetical protein
MTLRLVPPGSDVRVTSGIRPLVAWTALNEAGELQLHYLSYYRQVVRRAIHDDGLQGWTPVRVLILPLAAEEVEERC